MVRLNVLNIYFSQTGNTEKVAFKIRDTIQEQGYNVKTLRISSGDIDIDILQYNFVFIGSGVYGQLPGEPLMEFLRKHLQKYVSEDEVKPVAPKRPSAKAVVYCTYGGVHTGINEAIPTVKYMGQLFDHLGYMIVGEWCIVAEYRTEDFSDRSIDGRLGDIRGRPNQNDLKDIAERVKGILKT